MKNTLDSVRGILEALLQCRGIPEEEMAFGKIAKWDSLKHIEIIMALEEEFDVSFSKDDVVICRTLKQLADYIDGQKNG